MRHCNLSFAAVHQSGSGTELPTSVRVGEDVAIPPLTDPDVRDYRIRFFTGELRSQRCTDGRSEVVAEDIA